MVFDGECNFCRRWIARWQQSSGPRIEYLPFQDPAVAARFPEIPRSAFEESVQLIEPDGRVYSGAEAVFRALGRGQLYARVPALAGVSEAAYRAVARNRNVFSALTRWFWGKSVQRPAYLLTRWLFLRMLGVIYLVAFVSLWTQIEGLAGSRGILPAEDTMSLLRQQADQQQLGLQRFWLAPTLCWLNASDGFLNFLCGAGAALSLLLIAGLAPLPVLFLLWVIYLSLAIVLREFLSFQWDALLLETGFLAMLFAPGRAWSAPARERPPSLLALFLLRVLLFKLMFSAGVVKLSSGDPVWRNLTALTYHYETQPLPPWTAWYAHQLPDWFQVFCCAVMFGIELGVPFLFFAPRRLRLLACAATVLLQLLILLTGNYGFFNWLSIALCVLLLDDAVLRRCLPRSRPPRSEGSGRGRAWLLAPVAAVYVLLCAVQLVGSLRAPVQWPEPVAKLHSALAPFRTINGYGLFAVMTTSRNEIVVEGSNDGLEWRAYEFKHKPGEPMRRPGFVAPHQPRLDWQMWFAALGSYEHNPWFVHFCVRLLQGSPEVLALLAHNPFPDAPPRYIRAMLYDYRFTDRAARRADGTWWRRQLRGLYCPVLSLRHP